MFQLYKKRDFSSYIGDTFSFFKIFSKNYFKNYFIINGGFLLILVVSLFIFMKFFYANAFLNLNNQSEFLEGQFLDNLPLFIVLGILTILSIIILSLLNYLYPISYLKLIELNKETSLENLIQFMKQKVGKSILFFLFSLFTFLPLFIISIFICVLLVFLIIGIPLMMIVFPAMLSLITFSYYDYISTDNDFFKSFSNGFSILTKKFWPIVGSTFIMYIIIQIIVGIVYMVPYIISMVSLLSDPNSIQNTAQGEVPEALSLIMIVMSITMIVTIIFSYTLQNLLLINQGLMYYSSKEDAENNSIKSEIDLIGSSNE